MVSTLTYSLDGTWLFAGTESGDVVTVNVPRRAVQLMHPVASAGVTWTGHLPGAAGGRLLVGAADGTICPFDFQLTVHSAPPLAALPGSVAAVCLAPGGPPGRLLVGTRQGGIYHLDLPPAALGTTPQQPGGLAAAAGGGGATGTTAVRATSALGGWRAYELAQQGALLGLAVARDDASAVATGSADGSVCVWNAGVSAQCNLQQ
jgi:WD40 repeat protein